MRHPGDAVPAKEDADPAKGKICDETSTSGGCNATHSVQ